MLVVHQLKDKVVLVVAVQVKLVVVLLDLLLVLVEMV